MAPPTPTRAPGPSRGAFDRWALTVCLVACAACRTPPPCALPGEALTVRPNLDDDDGDGRIDGLQEPPPASDDDVTPLQLELTERCAGRLSVDAPVGEVRLWQRTSSGWAAVSSVKSGPHELGLEVVRGRSATWNGQALLRLSSADAGLPLRAPPFLLRAPETPVSEVWVTDVRSAELRPTHAFVEQLEAELPRGVRLRRLDGDLPGADRWVQDAFQAATVGGAAAMIRLPRAGPTRGLSELSFADGFPRDTALVGTGALGDSRFDYGGDVEVLSAHRAAAGDFPHGRLVVGEGLGPELDAWLSAQSAQGPAVKLPTGWLESGHVDDVLMPLPSTNGRVRVLFASTGLGLATYGPRADEPLRRFNAECQRQLDAAETTLRDAVAPAAFEPLHLPVVFQRRESDAGVFARPLFPNPVNTLVLGTTVLVGLSDGGLPERALAEVTTARLRDAGFSVRWLDVSAYTSGGGSIHCALETRPR